MGRSPAAAALRLLSLAAWAAAELHDTYDAAAGGRAVLLQLTAAPGGDCEACDATAAAWARLEAKTSSELFVRRVICDASDAETVFCQSILEGTLSEMRLSVPTVVHGAHARDLTVWMGSKRETALADLADSLRPACSAAHEAACSEAQREAVAAYAALAPSDLAELVATTQLAAAASADAVEDEFAAGFDELEDAFDAVSRVYQRRLDAMLDRLATMRAVAEHRGIAVEVRAADAAPPDVDDTYAADFAADADGYDDDYDDTDAPYDDADDYGEEDEDYYAAGDAPAASEDYGDADAPDQRSPRASYHYAD